jgi:branched-chain amino acid transport system ATP-binding protein
LASEALSLREIDAYYGDGHVLQQASFSAGAGRLLGLVGRNGAGKTTAINVAVGLLPPRAGSVEVFGSNVARFTPEAIAACGVALVPQGRCVFRSLTVRENLSVAARKPIVAGKTRWDLDTGVCHVSPPRRAAASAREPALRRRAADAGDWSRADRQSPPVADG